MTDGWDNDSSHIATLNPFFVCRIVIVGLLELNIKPRQDIPEDKIYQNSSTLDCKPFINTYYSIGHRLELKCFLFAQLLLNAHRAAHKHPFLRQVFNLDLLIQFRKCGILPMPYVYAETNYVSWLDLLQDSPLSYWLYCSCAKKANLNANLKYSSKASKLVLFKFSPNNSFTFAPALTENTMEHTHSQCLLSVNESPLQLTLNDHLVYNTQRNVHFLNHFVSSS